MDITDREKLQDVIKTNISLNEVTNNATAKVLDWEDKNPQGFSAPYDMIIASDVVADCYEESSTALIETLNRMSNESTVILLAYELRDLSGKKFFQLLKTSFTYKKVILS